MMVAGHLQIKNEKYYMVLELRTEQGERKTKWIGTGLAVKGNKRRAEAMLEETINPKCRLRSIWAIGWKL